MDKISGNTVEMVRVNDTRESICGCSATEVHEEGHKSCDGCCKWDLGHTPHQRGHQDETSRQRESVSENLDKLNLSYLLEIVNFLDSYVFEEDATGGTPFESNETTEQILIDLRVKPLEKRNDEYIFELWWEDLEERLKDRRRQQKSFKGISKKVFLKMISLLLRNFSNNLGNDWQILAQDTSVENTRHVKDILLRHLFPKSLLAFQMERKFYNGESHVKSEDVFSIEKEFLNDLRIYAGACLRKNRRCILFGGLICTLFFLRLPSEIKMEIQLRIPDIEKCDFENLLRVAFEAENATYHCLNTKIKLMKDLVFSVVEQHQNQLDSINHELFDTKLRLIEQIAKSLIQGNQKAIDY